MNNSLLIFLSLGIAVLALIVSAAAIVIGNRARSWSKLFGAEQEPKNLEEIIQSIAENIKSLKQSQNQSEQDINNLAQTLQTAVQFMAIRRFDSSTDDGGNLSFSLALLDGTRSGVIITSLHGRQHNRIYCKAVHQSKPQQTLSSEEQEALIDALTIHKNKKA